MIVAGWGDPVLVQDMNKLNSSLGFPGSGAVAPGGGGNNLPPALPPPGSPPDDEIDLGQLFGTIWRGKLLIAFATVVAIGLGAGHLANTAPTYQADALLQLEERSGRLALPGAMRDLVDNEASAATEMELLRSRMILGEAAADINHDWFAAPVKAPIIGQALSRYPIPLPDIERLQPFARPGDRIELDLLQVPPAWLDRTILLTATERGFTLVTPDDEMLEGRVGETLTGANGEFTLRLAELSGPPGRQFAVRQTSHEAAIARLRGNLSVAERGRWSGLLELRFTELDREQAVRALNAITTAYVRQNITRSAAEAQSSLDFIEQQLPEAETAVREAAMRLNRFRQEQAVLDLSFETQDLLTRITRTEAELRELDEREQEMAQRLSPNHPTYRQLLAERAALEARLETRLAELRTQASALPETQREMLDLTRELEMAQAIYNQLVVRAQEIRVVRASTIGNVRIVDSAVASDAPIAPRRGLILALSAVLGVMGGITLVLVRNWMRRGVQTPAELEQAGLPVFATINLTPYAPRRGQRSESLPIVALTHPTDVVVEAVRSLRTSLHFGMLDAQTRSVAITSSAPEAGKSFTSVNLAVVSALAGQRVALIDADMRRGKLRRYFGMPASQPGLAEYLSGSAALEDVLVESDIPDLWVMTAGRYPPNPSELLMRRELGLLVNELDARFDLSLFDCPPTLAVTDATIIGRSAGATIAVVRHDTTPMAEVLATRKTLEAAGVRLAGCVLNGFDPRRAPHGAYSYGYRYSYASSNA